MTEHHSQESTSNATFMILSKECWAILSDRWLSWVCATFLVGLLSLIPALAVFVLLIDWKGWNLLATLSMMIIARSALQPGYLQFCLRLASRQEARLSTLVSAYSLSMPFLIATVLFVIAVACGSLLFLIPGIFLLVRLSMYGFAIADQKCGPIAALQKSYKMTAPFALPLTACLVVCLLGEALTPVGYLFDAFMMLFVALVYNRVTGKAGAT